MRAGRGAAAAVAAAAAAAALAAAAVFGLDAAAGQAAEQAAGQPPAYPWGSAGSGAGHGGASAPYWRFLGGVAAGDSFSYRICDALYGPLAPRRVGSGDDGGGWACYLADLRIEAVVPVSGGRGAAGGADVYVVGAAADWEGGAAGIEGGAPAQPHRPDAVLLVVDGGDGRLAVRHALPADRALAESLQRTVFWRGGLGGGVELAYGAPAAELIRGVPSTALLVSGSHVSAGGLVVYTASHGLPRPAPYAEGGWRAHAGQGISKVALAAGVGLPVSARVYGGAPPPLDHYHPGRPLFEYEMVSLGRAPDAAHAQPAGSSSAHSDQISNPHYPVHGGRGHGPPSGWGDGGW